MDITHEEPQTTTPGRILRICVNEPGKPEVNVKIPLGLARIGMKLGARYAKEDLEKHGVDLERLLKEVDTVGKIADITDDKGHVEIFVE